MTASSLSEEDERPGAGREHDQRSNSRVTVEFDIPARMRDGVTLRANVYAVYRSITERAPEKARKTIAATRCSMRVSTRRTSLSLWTSLLTSSTA